MAIAFSRSIRSLKMDSFRFSTFGLAVTILLLMAWMAWFFLARISIYETSKEVKIEDNGSISVKFPAERMEMMQSGQMALVQVEGKNLPDGNGGEGAEGGEPRRITAQAMVMKVQKAASGEKQGSAELMLIDEVQAEEIYQMTSSGAAGKMLVQVEVERVAPFALIQRAARQYYAAAPGAAVPGAAVPGAAVPGAQAIQSGIGD